MEHLLVEAAEQPPLAQDAGDVDLGVVGVVWRDELHLSDLPSCRGSGGGGRSRTRWRAVRVLHFALTVLVDCANCSRSSKIPLCQDSLVYDVGGILLSSAKRMLILGAPTLTTAAQHYTERY